MCLCPPAACPSIERQCAEDAAAAVDAAEVLAPAGKENAAGFIAATGMLMLGGCAGPPPVTLSMEKSGVMEAGAPGAATEEAPASDVLRAAIPFVPEPVLDAEYGDPGATGDAGALTCMGLLPPPLDSSVDEARGRCTRRMWRLCGPCGNGDTIRAGGSCRAVND